jgi:hypothetical protein
MNPSILLRIRADEEKTWTELEIESSKSKDSYNADVFTFQGPPEILGRYLVHIIFQYLQSLSVDHGKSIKTLLSQLKVLIEHVYCFDSGHGSRLHYWIVCTCLKIFRKHILSFGSGLSEFRSFLRDSIRFFPDDSLLLTHMIELEQNFGTLFKLRLFFDQLIRTLKETNSTSALTKVWIHYIASEFSTSTLDPGRESRI